jgi:phospholipase/carboxylesterase
MSLESITIPPQNGQPAKKLLVMLHGWGANLYDLAPLANVLNLADYQFIFPNAPFAHPQVPGGRAWYSLDTRDYQGLTESRETLKDWLLSLEETTHIPLSKTVLTGFSQGGAMTLDVGLQLPLAAICSLSGYLHSQPTAISKPPVLLIHGTQDQVVPIQAAQNAKNQLTKLGLNPQYQEYNMGHEINNEAINLLRQFLLETV